MTIYFIDKDHIVVTTKNEEGYTAETIKLVEFQEETRTFSGKSTQTTYNLTFNKEFDQVLRGYYQE